MLRIYYRDNKWAVVVGKMEEQFPKGTQKMQAIKDRVPRDSPQVGK
jgi:tRNA(Phe) wybutosine-synthesizing methylase Tyw3